MITKNDLNHQKMHIEQEIVNLLDGIDDGHLMIAVGELLDERFQILIDKLEETNGID